MMAGKALLQGNEDLGNGEVASPDLGRGRFLVATETVTLRGGRSMSGPHPSLEATEGRQVMPRLGVTWGDWWVWSAADV